MKTRFQLAVVALAALAAAAPAAAAPAAAADEARPQFGFGVAVVPTVQPMKTVELYVPIQVAPNLRIEPSLGIAVDNGPSGGTDKRDVTLGVGGFLVKRLGPSLDLQLGGRLKLNFAKVSSPGVSESGVDFLLAGAAGGEFYLMPRFSAGIEGDLGIYSNSKASGDNGGLYTTGLVFLRLYL